MSEPARPRISIRPPRGQSAEGLRVYAWFLLIVGILSLAFFVIQAIVEKQEATCPTPK